ncbi:MAG TPA: SprB repeat-containing protein [Cyclobacteriaceae bacterium]|nr:SprB repeat-containing protein [Cyclobacteriaceae bacterium]
MSARLRITLVYIFIFLFAFERCAYNDINIEFDCSSSTLAIELQSKTDVSSCRAIDGAITAIGSGGLEPYSFNINGGEYQTNSTFIDLGPGTYSVRVKDANNCWKSIDVSISAAGSTLDATVQTGADNQCSSDNGTATVTVTGGVGPYQYQIDSKGYGPSNVFADLKEGQHVVVIKDDEGCQRTLSVRIAHGPTGISYSAQIKSIITTNCALSGCHGAGTGARDWTVFANVKSHASNIKTRVSNHTMPPTQPLKQSDIDLISCWVDDGALEN